MNKPLRKKFLKHLYIGTPFFFLFFFLFSSLTLAVQEEKQQEEKQKQKVITEEIVVEAKLPKELPLSTTTSIKREMIESLNPRDLSEVLSHTSGTLVSSGTKNEFRIKIRGFESQRVVLLYDGIPIYEPFFNSFDLKTILTEEVESIKVVKGASSVLYGPNALGGVVNIITRRPNPSSFSLKTFYDSNNALTVSSSGAVRWKNVFFSGFMTFDKSDGFRWNRDGKRILRENSDYERKNITGKVYFYPNQKSEILFEAAHYRSEFGIPIATEYFFPRYWKFKSWNRSQFNLGGTFSLFKGGNIKFRSYYVRHDNVLDAYFDPDMKRLNWESTYKNNSLGAFLLSSFSYQAQNEIKFSINFRDDNVRTQDDIGKEWEEFEHQIVSLGFENLFSLNPKWKLVGGINLDYLKKHTGDNKASLNPIAGIKFNPSDYIDLHLTFSQKSRFPSMRALYSTSFGNPDLKDERGTSYEFGFSYDREFLFTGAVFYNRIRDLINVIRLPDGTKRNLNIGKAHISGFEMRFQKRFRWLNLSVNYTYLDGANEEEKRPLDLVPASQLNFALDVWDKNSLKFTLWSLYVSSSEMKISNDIVKIPGYFVLNASLSKSFSNFTVFLKGENLLNKYYVTEPGYPMKARTVAVGLKYIYRGDEQ
ncbi:MAG: TonB-dependent receptor [Candidatus Aminicenantes bacterium]|nr:MAG: TonB-dependent receptor [Candidatus Aminicenantes bacterium]